MRCENCGFEIWKGAKFCMECGAPVKKETIVLSIKEELAPTIEELKQKVWYYFENKTPKGPYTQNELQLLYNEGMITSNTMVWKTDMEEVVRYHAVDFNTEKTESSIEEEPSVEEPSEEETVIIMPMQETAPEKTEETSFEPEKEEVTEPEEENFETEEATDEESTEEAESEEYVEVEELADVEEESEEVVEEVTIDAEYTETLEEDLDETEDEVYEPEESAVNESAQSPLDAAKWYYVDSAGTRQGPVTDSELKNLISEGAVDGMTYIWAPGMSVWSLLKDTEFDIQAETPVEQTDPSENTEYEETSFTEEEPVEDAEISYTEEEPVQEAKEETEWYYIDAANTRQGPVSESVLHSLTEAGVVHDMTYVWKPGMSGWVYVKDTELKAGKTEEKEFSVDQYWEEEPEENTEEPIILGTSGNEEKQEEETTQWYYLNRENTRFGPLSTDVMKKLLQDGTLTERTYVWRTGMINWAVLKDTELFEKKAEVKEPEQKEVASEAKWYYVDRSNNRQGPVSAEEIRTLLKSGAIHERTYLWTSGMTNWAVLKDTEFYVAEPKESKDWYYIDAAKVRQGKFSDSEMERFLQNGTINENTYVWKSGMAQWAKVSTTSLTSAKPNASSKTSDDDDALWFYRGRDNSRVGPFTKQEMEDLLSKGSITEQTDVWTRGMANWKALSATPLMHAESSQKSEQWYVQLNGQAMGPYSASVMQQMLQNKEITMRSYVWAPGMADWEQLRNTTLAKKG